MGNWGEESCESFETQDEINRGISSNGTHHAENGVKVEVVVDDGDDDHENEVPVEEGLVRQLERVELQGNGSDNAEFEGEQGEEEEEAKTHVYPLRPHAADCSFFLKTGTCKFGQNCRFNHPSKRVFQPVGDKEKGIKESDGSVVDMGKIECKYFPTPGGCKYGDACRYNHSARKVEAEDLKLNFLGLPIRPSAQECTFYLRTGSCGYGTNCRFNHPDPGAATESELGNCLANGRSARADANFSSNYVGEPLQSFGVSQGILESSDGINLRNGFYAPGMSSYHQTMPHNSRWNQSQVTIPPNKTSLPHQIMNNFSKKADPSTHYEHLMQIEEFPERPGQPDCDYFMKTGDCKYRSACRYNHPISRYSKLRLPPLSTKGHPKTATALGTPELPNSNPNYSKKNGMSSAGEFPERPGQPECEYYMKTGHCKFKAACRYHHPKNRMSTSSPCSLNEKGLPLRPGAKICRNYEEQGMCKYGRNCLFDHPDDSSPAVSIAPDSAQVQSSANVAVAADLESPAGNNVESDWDDGWAM